MRPCLTGAAVLATLILPQLPGSAAADEDGPPRPARAYAVVQRLVHHREQLALGSNQVAKLTQLAQRLLTNPGRLTITGNRAPGKASPRVERKLISRHEALRKALRVLTPEQRIMAARVIESDTTSMVQR